MMKWDMEIEEIEAVLEKIWDLHDKLSDAIHSISRTHFLKSVKTLKSPPERKRTPPPKQQHPPFNADEVGSGFVFVKGYRGAVDEDYDALAISEAKSLNAIRTALENLEDQLEFLHSVQVQQRTERDAAIARLEQSRIILSLRLAEHHGKKYKVIDEALEFVGEVRDSGCFVSPENLFAPASPSDGRFVRDEGKRSNIVVRIILSSFNIFRNTLKMDHMSGVLGNAALIAVSMLTLLHIQHIGHRDKFVLDHPLQWDDYTYSNRTVKKSSTQKGSSSNNHLRHLDVLLARG